MADVTLETLAAEVAYLKDAVNELLRRVGGVPPQAAAAGWESLPDPVPGEGIASYAARCGQFVGGPKGEQAVRSAGSMFLVGQYLVNKHGGSWKRATWEFIHGDPNAAQPAPYQTAPGRGTIPAGQLSPNDAAFLWHKQHDYILQRHNGDLFRDVCSGSGDDIARAIQKGDLTNPSGGPWLPDSRAVADAVTAAFAAIRPE